MKLNQKIAKRFLAVALSFAMVVTSLFVMPTAADAASKVTVTDYTSVKAGGTARFAIKGLKSTQYAKVTLETTNNVGSVNGTVTAKFAGKKVTQFTQIPGGKTRYLYVTNKNCVGETVTITVSVFNKAGKEVDVITETVKVYKLTKDIKMMNTEKTAEITEATVEVGKVYDIQGVKVPSNSTQKTKWTSSDNTIATVDNKGVVTGLKAGTVTITATSGKVSKSVTVTVVGDPEAVEIATLTAEKVNKLEATFAAAVDTTDVTLSLTRGNVTVPMTYTWNADKTVATITTDAKMIAGTYTLTAAFKATAKEVSKDVSVVDQYADAIVIKNTTALTNSDTDATDNTNDANTKAYAYYDVLDQYGESIRTSVTITWSASCKVEADKSTGKLTFTRTDNRAFTYNEQIYVTGVSTKTGLAVNETLTVGAEQALNSVEIAGFVKKGTAKLVQALPAGFKSGEYVMAYSVLDQNGNPMDPGKYVGTEVTFISDQILVVKAMETNGDITTVDGVQYSTVVVEPGIKVADGGEFNVTAIANKTGNKTILNVVVGEDAVVESFTMSVPSGIISDGGRIEIPFVALDQNGKEITNFTTLAKQKTFNTLTLNVSEGKLALVQEDDGTATLVYTDKTMPWSDSLTTDGIDRTVSLTSVVVGGNSCNILLSIVDKARPDAIAAIKTPSVVVEGAEIALAQNQFKFYDQYGRVMGTTWGADNGFFAASLAGSIKGTDFADYTYGLQITYYGNDYLIDNAGALNADGEVFLPSGASAKLDAATTVLAAKTGEGFKVEIAKMKNADRVISVTSTSKYHNVTIVDIAQVKNIAITELNKFYVNTANSENAVLDETYTITDAVANPTILADYQQKVVVTGTYNGTSVTIPEHYYTVEGKYLLTDGSLGDNAVNAVTGSALWSDFYAQVGSENYVRKDLKDTLTVKVFALYTNSASGDAIKLGDSIANADTYAPVDTASIKVTISDAAPVAATIVASDVTLNPSHTGMDAFNTLLNNSTYFTVLDQYGVYYNDVTFKVSNITENEDGYAQNNFKVANNASYNAYIIEGAELGDTFDLTIEAGDITKTIKVTVGADTEAFLADGNNNSYLDVLVNGTNGLEIQRQNGLQ